MQRFVDHGSATLGLGCGRGNLVPAWADPRREANLFSFSLPRTHGTLAGQTLSFGSEIVHQVATLDEQCDLTRLAGCIGCDVKVQDCRGAAQ